MIRNRFCACGAALFAAALLTAAARAAIAPALFGEGTISTGDMELNAAFTPDGKTLYFTKRSPKAQFWVLVESHFRAGRWTASAVVPFSGQYNDFDPFVSPDGKRLYWSSNRPREGSGPPKGDFDVWFVERAGAGWGPPQHLDAPVNTAAQEYYPTVTRDGSIYFSSNREGGAGGLDLYLARLVDGHYVQPENVGDSINTRGSEGDPYIAPDESFIVFVGYDRPGGSGGGDLHISVRRNGVWSKAENLGPEINSTALEFCPIMSPDGKWLYFTSDRGFADSPRTRAITTAELSRQLHRPGNGLGDIYRVDAKAALERFGVRPQ